jgi:hypothetical protein
VNTKKLNMKETEIEVESSRDMLWHVGVGGIFAFLVRVLRCNSYTFVSREGAKRRAAMSLIQRRLLQLSMNASALHHSMDSRSAASRTFRATCRAGVRSAEGQGAGRRMQLSERGIRRGPEPDCRWTR